MAAPPSPVDLRPPSRVTVRVVGLCWLAILAEGYDVGVMGAILPALATDRAWVLTPIQLGALGSYAIFGMLVGGAVIGTLADIHGRKRLFLGCVAVFSLAMAGAACAPTPTWFGLCRVIGGLGLGGIIPLAATYTVEFTAPERRGISYGIMYSGYSLGILAAALVAIALLPTTGWRGVVAIGAAPLVTVPLLAWLLPESLGFLMSRGRIEEAQRVARAQAIALPASFSPDPRASGGGRAVATALFGHRNTAITLCFWTALAAGLLLVYGLNTWLPQIMRRAGYDLGSSLMFLAVFSLAAAVGGVGAGVAADRRGSRGVVTGCFLLGAAAIAALSFKGSLATNIALVAVAGLGSIAASLILTAAIAAAYPPAARAGATGWALSIGRLGAMAGPLLGGAVASQGWDVAWNFYAFAIVGVVAAVATLLGPNRPVAG